MDDSRVDPLDKILEPFLRRLEQVVSYQRYSKAQLEQKAARARAETRHAERLIKKEMALRERQERAKRLRTAHRRMTKQQFSPNGKRILVPRGE